jgi:hypothetical protein
VEKLGQVVHSVVVGEEGDQVFGQVGVLSAKLVSVGGPAGGHCFQVGRDHRIDPMFPTVGLTGFVFHGLLLSFQATGQLLQTTFEKAGHGDWTSTQYRPISATD